MKHLAAAALAGVSLLLLAGCSAPTVGASKPATSPVAQPTTAAPTSSAPSDKGPNYVPVRADGTKPFGKYFLLTATKDEEVAFSKNVMVQVDPAGSYKPGPYASIDGAKAKKYTKYKITVINNHAKAEDLTAFSVSATDGDTDAGQVFEDNNQAVSVSAAFAQDDGTYAGGSPLVWTK